MICFLNQYYQEILTYLSIKYLLPVSLHISLHQVNLASCDHLIFILCLSFKVEKLVVITNKNLVRVRLKGVSCASCMKACNDDECSMSGLCV